MNYFLKNLVSNINYKGKISSYKKKGNKMLKLAMEIVVGGLITVAVFNNVIAPALEDAAKNTANCISAVSVCDSNANNASLTQLANLSNGILGK